MILRLEHIAKSYDRSGRRLDVLTDISLELDRGDFVGVFGPSRSGKTTLLRLIAGLEQPDRGTVSYQGQRLDCMSKNELLRYRRRELGCVWATGQVDTGLSVIESVMLPLLADGCDHRDAERRAREMLMACDAEHCIGADSTKLSDGESQRISIAQALISEPRLVLADRPALGLDLVERDSILALLQSLAREAKVTVLIADADPSYILRASPLFYLRDGEFANADPMSEFGEVIKFEDKEARKQDDLSQ